MKVVISTYSFLPRAGGVATTVYTLAEAFAAAGHDVTVITTVRSEGGVDAYPFAVVRNPDPWTLISHYRKADILLLSNLSLKLAYPVLLLGRKFGLSHHSESAWQMSDSVFSGDFIRKIMMRNAVHFMVSEYCGTQSGLKYNITYPFCNPKHITPERVRPPQERADVLFVGRLVEEKGILYVLERSEMILDALGEERLVVVGSGPLDGEIRRRLAQGEWPRVVMAGRKSFEDTAITMGKARFALVPSLWNEPFGAVAAETLAAGAIPIHSNRGGLPEATGPLGFAYDPDSDDSFRQALAGARARADSLAADPGLWPRYCEEVRDWTGRFAPQNVVDTIIRACAPAR